MHHSPLPSPDARERREDYSVKLTWNNLSFEQISSLIKQAYFFKQVVFADLYYYGQVFAIQIMIGPDDSTSIVFPNSGLGAITDDMVNLVIKELTSLPIPIVLAASTE